MTLDFLCFLVFFVNKQTSQHKMHSKSPLKRILFLRDKHGLIMLCILHYICLLIFLVCVDNFFSWVFPFFFKVLRHFPRKEEKETFSMLPNFAMTTVKCPLSCKELSVLKHSKLGSILDFKLTRQ